MDDLPRIPYGMAKDIIAMLRPGDVITIRPNYWPSFRQAAKAMSMHLSRRQVWNGQRWVMRLKRVEAIRDTYAIPTHETAIAA